MYKDALTLEGLTLSYSANPLPKHWKQSSFDQESSFHELSPYIGKLTSRIARELVSRYTKVGDLVVDPFAGSGTIPLESAIAGRRTFASDTSPYARVLTVAKLTAPTCLFEALDMFETAFEEAQKLSLPDLRQVPAWVRKFFHPETLKETINFSIVCRKPGREFLLACLLGVLHHQRPGFLSFPSSHLVPYLRDRLFPPKQYPEMYSYRSLRPRLIAKIERAYRRDFERNAELLIGFQQKSIQRAIFPENFDALITSPPYMNALDYGRDNRLRLWFIEPTTDWRIQERPTSRSAAFQSTVNAIANRADKGLRPNGYCILVVGEESHRKSKNHPSQKVVDSILATKTSLSLVDVLEDSIPDVRRSRRECRGVKTEHILVFRKNKNAR